MSTLGRLLIAGLWATSAACSEQPGGAGLDAGGGGSDDGGIGPSMDSGTPPGMTLRSIVLEPDQVELVSLNGSRPTQDFVVVGQYEDGSARNLSGARFSINPFPLGLVDGTGRFTASGAVGGTGRLRAELSGFSADAVITVRISAEVMTTGAPSDAPTRFSIPPVSDAQRASRVLYPLHGVVMPQNAYPATIQWSASEPNDLFRVTLEKPHVKIVAYLASLAGFDDAYHPEVDVWRRLAATDPDEPAQVSVDRLEAISGEVIRGEAINVRFVRASLSGSIYYWDIVAGRIVRIDDGTATRQSIMPTPPQGCIGCHSVSKSGRYMAGRFGGGDNVGSVVDLTRDLSTDPPPLEFPIVDSVRWFFSSWSPDDSRLIVSQAEFDSTPSNLAFLDPRTGQFVAPLEGNLPTGRVTHPDWAPDNSAIAYVGNGDAWGGSNTTGDIFILPLLGPDRVGASRLLIAGASLTGVLPAGSSVSYPSYSPDAALIAFAHGNSSRSETGLSALFAIKPDGSGVIRMNNASGGPSGDLAFQPRFSPFKQGGYYWLSFLSRRDYGNAKAGTQGSARQQIWVTAVKESAPVGEDPSEVPYWLSGQDTASLNISAYWAPRPCRAATSGCTVDADCCSGSCVDNGGGTLSCADQPAPGCHEFGDACGADGECCGGISCVGGVCGSL